MAVTYETFEIDNGHFAKLLNIDATKSESKKLKLIIIPGNPGLVEFYEQFAIDLNKLTDCQVTSISHTGHLFSENLKNWKPINVQEQIFHKLKFLDFIFGKKHQISIESIKPEEESDFEIVLIGHSVGCYVILEILEKLDESLRRRVRKAVLLFPTIERMNQSPNGKILTFMSTYFLHFIYLVVYLVTALVPDSVRSVLVNSVFLKKYNQADKRTKLNDNTGKVIFNMTKSFSCFRSAFHMGRDEMHVVDKLNKNAINQHGNKLIFYYGREDRWCPIEYYYDMVNQAKEAKVILDDCNLDHGFVIHRHQCEVLTGLIKEWIKP